jgi:hypothetical protein
MSRISLVFAGVFALVGIALDSPAAAQAPAKPPAAVAKSPQGPASAKIHRSDRAQCARKNALQIVRSFRSRAGSMPGSSRMRLVGLLPMS